MEKQSIGLRIEHKPLFFSGLGLVALGLVMPLLLTVTDFSIYDDINTALLDTEALYVIMAAIKLVLLNIIRGFPHYLGAFFLTDALGSKAGGKPWPPVRMALLLFPVLLVYLLIGQFYGIRYDFGVPAVVMVLLLLLLIKIDFRMVSPWKKALMVFFLLASIQCLDLMPLLDRLPFGHGETSYDIKRAGAFLGADGFLQISMSLLFAILFINALLLVGLIRDENRFKRVSMEKEQNERALVAARLRVLESRTYVELDHLVHDLKTPLTSMQALVGVTKLCTQDPKMTEYLTRTEASIERMSVMISEFLDENRFSPVDVEDLVSDLLAQTSNTAYAQMLTATIQQPGLRVYVNKVRFLRVLVNLIENSYHAVSPDTGCIRLMVFRREGPAEHQVCFQVQDNGNGIEPGLLNSIWDSGFSASGSHGLGLSFVQKVIACHKGSIEVTSTPGQGTIMTVCLPEEGACHEE